MEKSPNYEIGYTLVGASVWFLCYVPANVTVFLIVFAGYIQAQMLALAEELLHLWPDAELHYKNLDFSEFRRYNFNKERVLNDFIRRSLEDIIRKHAMNVNLLKQLEELFAGAIALEFMLLMLGLIAELLGGLQDTYLEVIYAFVQVAMDCWIGQQVMDASVAFERAVYGCRWENFDVSNMKVVLQILGNAQRTMKLSAGGVTMLSFASLMSVVKSIYSAYTTLRTAIK
uniref:Olfactory receptor 29 n=1 Tax=Cnaphalocrocis medinalis TaxID=437488 RepID=A0A1B2G2M2_CNAME|nr:olfactory receptor 29 [Cnaphalocrocis medinalis]